MAVPPREELIRLVGRSMAGDGTEHGHGDLVSRPRAHAPTPA